VATEPYILSTDPAEVLAGWVAAFESELGRTLQPAQAEMLLANAAAYREVLLRETMRSAILQEYLAFSAAPFLDYIAERAGVTRLAATPATCTLRFVPTTGHTGVTVPAGTTVRTTDGGAVFQTDEELVILTGATQGDVTASALADGETGNGYISGTVSALQTPIVNIVSVANLATTGGGAEQETDDRLRARVQIAPSQYSTAGSVAAYKFHALSAHPDILDVAVPISPSPAGTVNVYILTAGASAPSGVLTAVEDALSAETVRPLTDTVIVSDTTRVDFDCELDITILSGYVASDVLDAVEAAMQALFAYAAGAIGRDVTISKIIAEAMVPGVYSVGVLLPLADVVVSESEVASNGSLAINNIGTNNG